MTSYLVPFRSYRSLLFRFWTFCVFEPPPLWGFGTTYDVHLGLIGRGDGVPIRVNGLFLLRLRRYERK